LNLSSRTTKRGVVRGFFERLRERVFRFFIYFRKVYKQANTQIDMDKRNRYGKVLSLLAPIRGQKVSIGKLKNLIMINIGSTEKTIEDILKFMISLNLITETESFIFKVSDELEQSQD
jgi:hypothetical protein